MFERTTMSARLSRVPRVFVEVPGESRSRASATTKAEADEVRERTALRLVEPRPAHRGRPQVQEGTFATVSRQEAVPELLGVHAGVKPSARLNMLRSGCSSGSATSSSSLAAKP